MHPHLSAKAWRAGRHRGNVQNAEASVAHLSTPGPSKGQAVSGRATPPAPCFAIGLLTARTGKGLAARGLSTRDIAAFTDADGRRLVSRAAVNEITERLWGEYEAFTRRDLSEFDIVYLFVDGIAERLRAGCAREPVIAAWGIGRNGQKVLLHLFSG